MLSPASVERRSEPGAHGSKCDRKIPHRAACTETICSLDYISNPPFEHTRQKEIRNCTGVSILPSGLYLVAIYITLRIFTG